MAKITGWYDTYHCYLHDRHIDQYECQQKYGTVFRYGPNYLVINTAGGLQDIYTNAKVNPIKKGPQYFAAHERGVVSTHSAIDKNTHAFKRRVLNYAFSEQALRNLEPMMIETIDKWLGFLGAGASDETKGWTQPKNMAAWSNYVTMDVLGDLCFGKPFGLLESEEHRGIPGMMLMRAEQLSMVGSMPLYASSKLIKFSSVTHP